MAPQAGKEGECGTASSVRVGHAVSRICDTVGPTVRRLTVVTLDFKGWNSWQQHSKLGDTTHNTGASLRDNHTLTQTSGSTPRQELQGTDSLAGFCGKCSREQAPTSPR
eukprot:gene14918-biopygen15702